MKSGSKRKTFLKKTSFERMRRINWSILGHFCFTIGNILWIVSPAMCWALGTPGICYYVELGAAVSFVFDGFFQLVGGYLHIYGGGIGTTPFRQKLESVNWFLLLHLFFFYGALGDVMTASIDSWTDNPNTTWWSMWSDFIASILWLISAIFSVVLWYLDTAAREFHNARIQQKMFSRTPNDNVRDSDDITSASINNDPSSNLPRRVMWISMTGWSVWTYVLASIIYAYGAVACYLYEDGRCWIVELVAAVVFFVQGIFDMIDFYRRKYYTELDLADEQDSVNIFLERNKMILPLHDSIATEPSYENAPPKSDGSSHSSMDLLSMSFKSSDESRSSQLSNETVVRTRKP